MTQDKIQLLRELGFNLTALTMAAIVADLNGNEGGRLSHNMSMVLDIIAQCGEENAGPDEFSQMVADAEADRMPH